MFVKRNGLSLPATHQVLDIFCTLHNRSEDILLYGRSEVIFDPKVSYFTTVPKSVYRGKVTWERAVDDLGTVGN